MTTKTKWIIGLIVLAGIGAVLPDKPEVAEKALKSKQNKGDADKAVNKTWYVEDLDRKICISISIGDSYEQPDDYAQLTKFYLNSNGDYVRLATSQHGHFTIKEDSIICNFTDNSIVRLRYTKVNGQPCVSMEDGTILKWDNPATRN